jgi:hypothetical protein
MKLEKRKLVAVKIGREEKENAQKNTRLISKIIKLQNYFFKLETGGYKNII